MDRTSVTSRIPTGLRVPRGYRATQAIGGKAESGGKVRFPSKTIPTANEIDPEESLIEDENFPPLFYEDIEDTGDDPYDWEPINISEIDEVYFRKLKAEWELQKMRVENSRLQQENQRLKTAAKGVRLFKYCCLKMLLVVAGEVAQSLFV
ncbi:uncharacterized protein LOC129781577 isoform X1 [Toxorhynchites rutilus septentrionalis]|uniref:uncharacterized protein LOC129781577 isoform X1 n=1 Tax=Toxorhynchites rutilus septentrionalis TaxID=329112 RepID=UPI00247AE9E7|nr:uncharacterized protein LOC129781577 isoform X1 [Toxorhynchites rutilus septentrionalis]